ncbi:MAG: preprotein translocase subunit SecY [Thermogutta sp.]
MLEKLRVIFSIKELRTKILLTLLLLAIYRVGEQIPVPGINTEKMSAVFGQQATGGLRDLLDQVTVFAASRLDQATIFGLGIMPYISASIIFQLLGTVYPPLEKLQKEGPAGYKKINEYTRYATVAICLIQSYVYVAMLIGRGLVRPEYTHADGGSVYTSWIIMAVLTMTAGTTFLMWLGEQIDEYGIGNGISLLIMASILARMLPSLYQELRPVFDEGLELSGSGGKIGADTLLILMSLFVAVVAGVIFITRGQRRIITQSAKHVRGRRVYGGARDYLPLLVNQAGVMPIIFASSLLLFPLALFQSLANMYPQSTVLTALADVFHRGDGFWYNGMYIGLIYFFCYFWTAITFNPKDIADRLKDNGSIIMGHRPGRRTAEYLEKVMVRITFVGAGFLAAVAIIPTIVADWMGVNYQIAQFYGGTSLLIAVSVAFDLVQKIDSHIVMRNYKGLLEG